MKTVKADSNTPVFTTLEKGVYGAQLFGYNVICRRLTHNMWELRVVGGNDDGKLISVAETRTKVLAEGFRNIKRDEEQRLEWVLSGEPLREYGIRGSYGTSSTPAKKPKPSKPIEKPSLSVVQRREEQLPIFDLSEEDADEVESKESRSPSRMAGDLRSITTPEQFLRINKLYKVRKNTTGQFFVTKFNFEGLVETFDGPHETAGKAYERILELENVEIPSEG